MRSPGSSIGSTPATVDPGRIHPRVAARPQPQMSMVDQLDEDPTPRQAPKLSELEAARAHLARQRTVEWLMVSEGGPDVATMVAQLVHRPSWHALAASRGVGVDAFFVEHGGQFDGGQRRLCESCPVRQECLETALADVSLSGMWGGTTPVERKAMRQPKATPVHVRDRELELRWAEGEIVDEEDQLGQRCGVGWWA